MTPVVLCLHGWGGSKESFDLLRGALRERQEGDGFTMLTPDLPGFGDAPDPATPWSVEDYADWVVDWMQREHPKEARLPLTLLGHSHGGRIAIVLAARQAESRGKRLSIEQLVLCAAAGIRRPRHWKRIVGLLLAKAGKTVLGMPGLRALQPFGRALLYRLVRVHDYEHATPVMQRTLVKVSAQDLRPLLATITVPTRIFWGERDGLTPVADAHVLHRGIRGSTLTIFPVTRHAVHKDRAKEIASALCEPPAPGSRKA